MNNVVLVIIVSVFLFLFVSDETVPGCVCGCVHAHARVCVFHLRDPTNSICTQNNKSNY